MNYIRNTYMLPRHQAQMDWYQLALKGSQQAAAAWRGQSFMFAIWDEMDFLPAQDGWDLVLDGGTRLPFPAASPGDQEPPYSGAMQISLVSGARGSGKSNMMHNFMQGLAQSPSCGCPVCQSGYTSPVTISSGSGYTSGGRLVPGMAQGPWQSPSWNSQPPSPRFSNKGMAGFDGLTLPELDAGLGTEEMPDVYGVLRGYRWWSLAAPDLSKSPAHADEDWPRSPLRGMRDTWNDGENIARCLAGSLHEDAEIPHNDCSCGFWAYWTLQVHDIGAGQLPVCGVVEGYGATVIGTRGFRAAKARIVGLHLPFTIQSAGDPESDPDPLGLGLPVSRPGQGSSAPSPLYPAGQQPNGAPKPWHSHPKFTGRVYDYRDHEPAPPPPPELDKTSAASRQSNRDRAEAWLAVIGDRLSVMYPSAKIFETRAAMEAEFPPDLSYVPGSSQEQCSYCYGWYSRKLNHKASCPNRRD